jgi:hypothetical protein
VSDPTITWDLVNPEGAFRPGSLTPAPRPATLEGATIGLAWNGKPGGDHALDEIAALLGHSMGGSARFIRYWETVPESVSPRELSDDVIRRMAASRPDVVIVSQAD